MGDDGRVSETARRKRGFESVADMGRSLGLVAAFALVILLIGPARSLLFPTGSDRMPTVDYREQVLAARQAMRADVPAPAGLPSGWRATSARVSGGGAKPVLLHIGFATPAREYAAVEETDATRAAAAQSVLGSASPRVLGTVDVGGQPWDRVRAGDGDLALVRETGRLTVIVTGTADERELVALASSLR